MTKLNFGDFPSACGGNYAVILLNGANSDLWWLNSNPRFIRDLWNGSSARLCADGAANYVLEALLTLNFKYPNKIVGDFDSITQEAKDHFTKEVRCSFLLEKCRTSKCSISRMTKIRRICKSAST